jgi:diguanylate cyclase (GGDEF)-like protein
VVEDDPSVGSLFEQLLPAHGYEVAWHESAEKAIIDFHDRSFDLVVADKNLPGMNGLELLKLIKEHNSDVDVIIMTAYADMGSILAALEAGVYDYLTKPFESIDEMLTKVQRAIDKRRMVLENRRLIAYLTQANHEIEELNQDLEQKVVNRTSALREANERLEQLTLTDDITELYNQRFLHSRLDEEFQRAHRHDQELSLLMFDLDDFKRVNDDRHDHLFGTRVLRRVSQVVKEVIRNIDLPIRYGGDEFIIILPHTDVQEAVQVAQRLRTGIEKRNVGDGDGDVYHVTASVGVASVRSCEAESANGLLRAADRAMYKAKENGRNNVSLMNGKQAVSVLASADG